MYESLERNLAASGDAACSRMIACLQATPIPRTISGVSLETVPARRVKIAFLINLIESESRHAL